MWDRAITEEEGRVLLAQPFDDLGRHPRLRPGLDLARMDDAAIAPARLHRRLALAFDQDDVVAGFLQIPRGRRPNDARAENHRGHHRPQCLPYASYRAMPSP